MKKILILLALAFAWIGSVFSQSYHIIPQAISWDIEESRSAAMEHVSEVSKGGEVWAQYNEQLWQMEEADNTLWMQFATWIMDWDTILNFAAYLVAWMSWVWLVIWAGMIIYSWYIYASAVFTGNASKWSEPVKNAIIWIVIIIFSYAIIRIITEMFL